ncbi:hypothetical protein [Streptomyces sp. NPDC088730]|uniref:hypothetical protein n=1 Tax=Streptomyces sp. NPDC088730 TaxID=3365877 RepID=UPI00380FE321
MDDASLEARSLQLAADRRVSLNSFRRREVVSSAFDSGMVVLKLDAQRWLYEVTASAVTGQYVDPCAGRITFAKYAERWQGSLIASEACERITDHALRLHLVPALSVRSPAAIRRNDKDDREVTSDGSGRGGRHRRAPRTPRRAPLHGVAVHDGAGEPLNYRRWKTEWNCARKALQAAENEAAEREGGKFVELPHLVTHDRPFCASALIGGGASVKQVQMALGPASAVIPSRIYARPRPNEEDRTRSVTDALAGARRAGCGQVADVTGKIAGQTV